MPNLPFSLTDLRDAIESSRYQAQYHAMQRLLDRGYTYADIKDIILNGDLIESYPKSKPHPKCLIMAHLGNEPTYVSVAYDQKNHYAYIITVHGYDPDKWSDPWTRKTP